jgi:hypothetical protein
MKITLTFAFTLITLLLTNMAVAEQDQGMTSKTHSANVGKIVWAKERITRDIQDQITLATAFNAGDPLYGRIYLAKSLVRLGGEDNGGKCKNPDGNYRIKVSIDGQSKGILNEQWVESPTWTTMQIGLNLTPGDQGDRQNLGVPEKWAAMIKELPDKTHQVKLELWGGPKDCELKYAEGEFSLSKAGEEKPVMGKLPEAMMKNPALEQEMVDAIKGQGWTNEFPIKIVIIESDWRMIRDAFNNITDREINTHSILKKTQGGTCRANDISFRQPHLGSEKFGKTQFYGFGLKSYPVNCQ